MMKAGLKFGQSVLDEFGDILDHRTDGHRQGRRFSVIPNERDAFRQGVGAPLGQAHWTGFGTSNYFPFPGNRTFKTYKTQF